MKLAAHVIVPRSSCADLSAPSQPLPAVFTRPVPRAKNETRPVEVWKTRPCCIIKSDTVAQRSTHAFYGCKKSQKQEGVLVHCAKLRICVGQLQYADLSDQPLQQSFLGLFQEQGRNEACRTIVLCLRVLWRPGTAKLRICVQSACRFVRSAPAAVFSWPAC